MTRIYANTPLTVKNVYPNHINRSELVQCLYRLDIGTEDRKHKSQWWTTMLEPQECYIAGKPVGAEYIYSAINLFQRPMAPDCKIVFIYGHNYQAHSEAIAKYREAAQVSVLKPLKRPSEALKDPTNGELPYEMVRDLYVVNDALENVAPTLAYTSVLEYGFITDRVVELVWSRRFPSGCYITVIFIKDKFKYESQ